MKRYDKALPPAPHRGDMKSNFLFGPPTGGQGAMLGQGAVLCLLFTFLSIAEILGQGVNLGVPPIWNFSRKIYKAGTQNWDAAQDVNGRIYFANNDGVLCYDGTHWENYPVSNHTNVRSVAIDEHDRIFAGAQSDLGYFFPDENGVLRYTSLIGLLPPDHRAFEDVWDIVFSAGHVFFRTNRSVFEYTGDTMLLDVVEEDLQGLFSTSQGLFLQKNNHEILVYKNGAFEIQVSDDDLESSITGILPWTKDTMLLTTLKNGIFYLHGKSIGPWLTSHDDLLIEKRIYSSTLLSNGNIALGTSLDGVIVLDKQRRVYRHLNKKHGLQNSNVLVTYCDLAGNLWLGYDNGIDCVVMDSKFSTIYPDGDLHATAYSAAVFDHQLYFGVSNGAYVAPWQSYYDPEEGRVFQRVTNAEGQVWGFNVMKEGVLMGHHEGAFALEHNVATPISKEPGTWIYIPLNDHYMMAGTYTGLVLYTLVNGHWSFDHKINGIHESCRIMVRDDDGSIWVSHPYRGLYHVIWNEAEKYDPQIKFFDQSGGLPSNLNNYVFSIAGRAVFGTEKGVYQFDRAQDRFVPDTAFNKWLGADHRVKAMKEDGKGNIWYVADDEVGLLEVSDLGVKKEVHRKVFPELSGKLVGGFEFIYPVDENNVLFGTEEGFVLYNAALPPAPLRGDMISSPPYGGQGAKPGAELHLILHSIRASRNQDTVLFGGFFLPDRSMGITDPQSLEANLNHLSFSYSATEYKTPYLLEYRTRLEGLEDDWSPWSTDTRRDFTSLGPGSYNFHAQARIRDGAESNVVSYMFRIRPPWYTTTAAKVFYGFGFIGLFAGFMMRQRRKFETEKARMTETHQEKEALAMKEAELSKAALSEIQNEKLEVEIKYKNQELALTTMHLVQKAEILLAVQEGLHHIQEKSPDHSVKKEIQQLLNMVNTDVKLDDDWEHFAQYFDQVHVDFLKQLRDRFPQLSASDLKLCAYLRMNLSTKEIAPLLNISVRGVEGSRYRLRKKLNLANDSNLTEFILGVSANKNSAN